jgi:hypothetical protein
MPGERFRLNELSPLSDAATRIWIVEKNGRPFGRLEDARFQDMFWVNYRVVDLTERPGDRDALFSKIFWHEAPLPTYRHAQTGHVNRSAFAGGLLPTPESPWVSIRALHPPALQRGRGARIVHWIFDLFVR